MRTLLVNGSPHAVKGVHITIIDAFEKGLQNAGSETTRFDTIRQNINPCNGCFTCWTNTPGKCVQKDDMEFLLAIVRKSDLLVLATPVYVDGMTGSMKVFMDRLIPLLKGSVELREDHMRHIRREDVSLSKIVLLSASGFAELNNFDPLISHVKAVSKNIGCEYAGEILLPSGWFLLYDTDNLTKVTTMIENAAMELVNNGKIPDHISSDIHALVNRSEVMNLMNRHYGRFE
jgi:multimeric flavodoxin WrbA